jgi:adenylate cyclase
MPGEQSRPTIAELERAGLYDPGAPDAADRLALLQYLLDLGATLDDLLEEDPRELPILATTLRLWPSRSRFTLDEAAARSGVDVRLLRRTWRAAGFPDPEPTACVFTERDIDLFRQLSTATALLGEDVAVHFVRVVGAAAARVADAAITAFVVNVGPSALERDPSDVALARANVAAVELLPSLTEAFDVLLRHHLAAQRRPIEAIDVERRVDLQSLSVGFVDLVGSTMLANTLEPEELASALTRFDASSSEIVTEHGGRVIKLIGDEIMFVAADADIAVDTALALVEALDVDEVLPPARASVASGEVVARDGDYSGPIVNLAARAGSVARPSSVLIDRSTRDHLTDTHFSTRDAGQHRLKGFERRIRLYRVRRTDEAPRAGTRPRAR